MQVRRLRIRAQHSLLQYFLHWLLLLLQLLLRTMNTPNTVIQSTCCSVSLYFLTVSYTLQSELALRIAQTKFPCMRRFWWRICVYTCLLSHLAVIHLWCQNSLNTFSQALPPISLAATSISIDFSAVHLFHWKTDIVENGKTMSGLLLLFCFVVSCVFVAN